MATYLEINGRKIVIDGLEEQLKELGTIIQTKQVDLLHIEDLEGLWYFGHSILDIVEEDIEQAARNTEQRETDLADESYRNDLMNGTDSDGWGDDPMYD